MIQNRDTFLAAARAFFDHAAPEWDTSCECDHEKIAALLRIAGIPKGARILDVACGTGILFPHLLSYNPEYFRAIDLSSEMVRIAKEKFPGLQVSAEDFYEFSETGFDIITLYNAYPHFPDKEAFARAALRVLKPGGRIIIAHGAGRDVINNCHTGDRVGQISAGLGPAAEEANVLAPYFHFDTVVDREHLYLLSGTAL